MKRLLCLLCIAVMLLPGIAAGAAKDFVLWLSPDGERNIRAIDWYKERNVYYLFLPGNIQPEQMKIGTNSSNCLIIRFPKETSRLSIRKVSSWLILFRASSDSL